MIGRSGLRSAAYFLGGCLLALGLLRLSTLLLDAKTIYATPVQLWTQVSVTGLNETTNVYAVERVGDLVLVGTQNQGLFRSSDGGLTWESPSSLSSAYVRDIWIANNPFKALAATYGQGVWESINGGQTWREVNTDFGTSRFYALASSASYLYVASADKGIWRSSDRGKTWETTGSLGDQGAVSLATSSNVVYAGSVSNGLFRSLDAGDTWEQCGFPGKIVRAVAVDPNDSNLLIVSVIGEGLFLSNDGGDSWAPISSPKPSATIYALMLESTGVNRRLIAGVAGGGVYVRSLALSDSWEHWLTASVSVFAVSSWDEYYYAGAAGTVWRTWDVVAQLYLPVILR